MRWNTFPRSAAFAALVAAVWFPWVIVVGPVVGGWRARTLYLAVATVVYLAGVAPDGRRRVRGAGFAVLATAALALVARTSGEWVIGLALTIAVVRSGILYPGVAARAAVAETVLIAGGLSFARFLAGPSLPATGLALWGFLLVQSFFWILPRGGVGAAPSRGDPFEDAQRRMLSLLERPGV